MNPRILVLVPLMLSLIGCRITQVVGEGGSVVSRTGLHDCGEGQTCSFDVEEGTKFSDTFTAVPNEGQRFIGWDDGLCGFSAGPCVLENIPGELTMHDVETFLVARFAPVTDRTYAIVDTGQTTCYHSSTGQATSCGGLGHDADHTGNQPGYTVSGDQLTVTDNVTALTWLQSSDITGDGAVDYDDKLYQSEAVGYCENLSLAGRDDWRLHGIKEAYSLIMFSGRDPSSQGDDSSALQPFLDSAFDWAFGDLDSGIDRIIDAQYASSTLYLSTTMNGNPTMFGVNFVDGRIKGYPTHTKKYYVRCVSGNTDYGFNDFVDNGDQTISDEATGLMWQQDDTVSTNWVDAVSICEAATTASHDNWRLPDAKELHSILDYSISPDTHGAAAINPLFNASSFENEAGDSDWGGYWSSTSHVNDTGDGSNAAYLSFGRSLGYMQGSVQDVHGAGAQRSDDKTDVSSEPRAQSATGATGTFYYKGPQGDILRDNNMVRCVRDVD